MNLIVAIIEANTFDDLVWSLQTHTHKDEHTSTWLMGFVALMVDDVGV